MADVLGTVQFDATTELLPLGGFDIVGSAQLDAVTTLSGTLGDFTQPTVDSVTPLTSTSVRVTFDRPMLNNAELQDPASYGLTPAAGGVIPSVQLVEPEAVTYPTYVDLTTSEHTDSIEYTATVSDVRDYYNNLIDPLGATGTYTGIGTLPQLAAVDVVSSTRLRLTFSEEMKKASVTNPASYSIVPTTPGAAPVYLAEVETPAGDNFPDTVDLPISEMTDGANYEVTVATSGPVDRANNTMDPGNNSLGFVGVGTAPGVARVEAIGPNRVDVVYDEPMLDNADLRDPAKYVWDNGLSTLSVLDVLGDTVQLVTSDQAEGTLYTLTISN